MNFIFPNKVFLIVWSVHTVWSKVRRRLYICTIIWMAIFTGALAIGIINLKMEAKKPIATSQYTEFMAIFIVDMIVLLFVVLATFVLARNNPKPVL